MENKYSKWIQAINDSANDQIPVFFHTMDASYVCMTLFSVATIILQKRQQNLSKYDKSCPVIIMFNNQSREFYEYKTNEFYRHFPNLWKDENKNNYVGIYGNSNDVPNNNIKDVSYNGNEMKVDELEAIINFINKNKDKKDFKFDYWIDDYRIARLYEEHSETLFYIFKYVRNLNVIPNGSLHWASVGFFKSYIQAKNNNETFYSYQEQKWLIEAMFTNSERGSKEYKQEFERYKMSSLWWFTENSALLHLFTLSPDWYHALKIEDNRLQLDLMSLDLTQMPNMFNTDQDQYDDIICNIFNINKNIPFESSVVKNLDIYSKDKNNLILLMTPELGWRKQDTDPEFKKMIEGLTKLYSPEKYNYIFKCHPRKELNEMIQNTFDICGDSVKPIIVNNSIPLELILFYDIRNNLLSKQFNLFNPYDYVIDNIKPENVKGFVGGCSINSSFIIMFTNYLNQMFDNFNWDNVLERLVPIKANYFMEKFIVGSPVVESQKWNPNGFELNVQYTYFVNQPFIDLHRFIDPRLIGPVSSLWKK